jgi:hypothetical protein
MRLYTTAAYKHMNVPLRDDARYNSGHPCPLPVATYFANQANTSRPFSPNVSQTRLSSM